jgi:hypothetical protein
MINAPVGEMTKVTGRSIDMAPTGPNPGKTPTKVPATAPIKHRKRFTGVNTTPNPYSTFSIRPITSFLQSPFQFLK